MAAANLTLLEIREGAVIGVPDEKWGEAVTAIAVLKDGAALDDGQILAHCKGALGGVKAPKSIEFRDQIPKTPTGKTDKKALRAPHWAGLERAGH